MLKQKMVNIYIAHPKESIKYKWHFLHLMTERNLGNHIHTWVAVFFYAFLSSWCS